MCHRSNHCSLREWVGLIVLGEKSRQRYRRQFSVSDRSSRSNLGTLRRGRWKRCGKVKRPYIPRRTGGVSKENSCWWRSWFDACNSSRIQTRTFSSCFYFPPLSSWSFHWTKKRGNLDRSWYLAIFPCLPPFYFTVSPYKKFKIQQLLPSDICRWEILRIIYKKLFKIVWSY